MQKLTRAEEELMQNLWKLGPSFLKDIIDSFPEPRTAQSTVSTLLKILETKGFVDHKVYGKSFEYIVLVPKDEYAKAYFGSFLNSYFGGSFKKMLNFFVEEDDLDMKTLDELVKQIQDQPKEEK